MTDTADLRERYRSTPVQHAWPDLDCYGCGPANDHGIGLESTLSAEGEALEATVEPEDRYRSGVPDAAYGGYVASLIDCHSIWTAVAFAHLADATPIEEAAFQYVTAGMDVSFERPTPLSETLHVRGTVASRDERTATVETTVAADGERTASGTVEVAAVEGLFRV